jgi:hypothetical protein
MFSRLISFALIPFFLIALTASLITIFTFFSLIPI